MTAVLIGPDATRSDIEQAIRWTRRSYCLLSATRLELEEAVDDLLDRWPAAAAG